MLVLPYRCLECHLRFFQFRWRKAARGRRSHPCDSAAAAHGAATTQDSTLEQQAIPDGAPMTPESTMGQRATPRDAATAQDSTQRQGATPHAGVPPLRRREDLPPGLVLGVNERATPEEVSAAYHRLAQLYHPDKVAGLAPEFQALAEKRMREINAAYEVLKQRG